MQDLNKIVVVHKAIVQTLVYPPPPHYIKDDRNGNR